MNLDSLKALATSKFARQALIARKHSPKVLFVAGTVGVIGTVVLACRATLKVQDTLEQHEKALLAVDNDTTLDSEDYAKRVGKLKVQTAIAIAKPYLPVVGLGIISIGALTGSHVILTKRNGAVMAAYAGLQKAYDEYRGRVRDEYGKDVDAKFATGVSDLMVEEKTADGKTKTKDQPHIDDRFGGSPYAVVFDERSSLFSKEPGRNAMTINLNMNWANDKLRAQGHLFLNEVYDMLKLPRTKAGACVGWVYDPKNPNHAGDNYVTFGVFDGENEWVEAFLDGSEKYAVLDFNVDGMILDLI